MKADNDLSPRQRKAIAALLQCRTAADAAQRVNVTERTLRRWLADDRFVAELKAAESSAIEQAVRRLAQIAGGAIDVLNTIMLDTDNPPAPRVAAATNALSQLLKLRELHDLEERLSKLEQAANESKRR